MTEQEWPQIRDLISGFWPGRDLGSAAPYVRLLPLQSVADVERAVLELAHTAKFAPSPAELLQAVTRRQGMTVLERECEYGEQVNAWLRKHFPEFDRPVWGPHPAAFVAVLNLHYRHGKGRLTKRAHGGEIRAAVAAWEAEYGEQTIEMEAVTS